MAFGRSVGLTHKADDRTKEAVALSIVSLLLSRQNKFVGLCVAKFICVYKKTVRDSDKRTNELQQSGSINDYLFPSI